MIKISVVGGSGYTGGEAIRLIHSHPHFELFQVTSETYTGKPLFVRHPQFRGVLEDKFISTSELQPCDVLILALPHGEAQKKLSSYEHLASTIVDLSADFRLHELDLYKQYYGDTHASPEHLGSFVNCIPELYRDKFTGANRFAGAGCIATSCITSLWPLVKAGVLTEQSEIFIDAKIGSSAAGAKASPSSHHPEREGCYRSFAPTEHRHTAEIRQALGENGNPPKIYLSATSTPSVRGILTTAQTILPSDLGESEIWGMYRECYGREPFVRIVKDKRSIYRYPEPKVVAGTNFIDIGFEREPSSNRLVVMAAIDNLVKGSAGNVIQALNIRFGFEERAGLEFIGIHPI